MNDKDSMNTIYYNDTVQLQPCVATIGFFDGVHRGHQFLIHHLVETARKDGLQSTVITFDAHPRKVLQADYQPEMLSTLDSKLLLLSKTEVDNAVVLHFDKAMAAMSAREFMQQVLHDHLNVRNLFNAKALMSHHPAFRHFLKDRGMILVLVLVLVVQWIIVTFGGEMFRTTPLSLHEWLLIIGSTSVVLWVGELWRGFKRMIAKRR